ncbi:transposase [Ruminiclostridium herbifermentans]|uniref:Transposase n=1 Tax=Ruminiclostridium herbifermentans TaxID=2488810 RepID=A0A4U7JFL3_9FIRM|nr:transposase [Ruminiclostridium herbifermentans]QNU65816.1 transposase [Ruminiclostridium herbifermentans]
MSVLPKDFIQEIIQENDFKNPGDIMSFLKEAFKDVLQEMLEAEMDMSLGYSRDDSSCKLTDNSRNGYSTKRLKSEFGPVEIAHIQRWLWTAGLTK